MSAHLLWMTVLHSLLGHLPFMFPWNMCHKHIQPSQAKTRVTHTPISGPSSSGGAGYQQRHLASNVGIAEDVLWKTMLESQTALAFFFLSSPPLTLRQVCLRSLNAPAAFNSVKHTPNTFFFLSAKHFFLICQNLSWVWEYTTVFIDRIL